MRKSFFTKLQKKGVGIIFTLLFFSTLLAPRFAFAQAAVGVVANAPDVANRIVDNVKETAKQGLTASIVTYLINVMTFAADRAAYDAAVLIASGGNGETPLFDKRTIGQYFKDVGEAVGGEAIGLLNEDIQGAGGVLSNFNVCAPRSPYILLSLRFGIKSVFQRPEPKCDINQVTENWKGFLADVSLAGEGDTTGKNQLILTKLANAFEPGVSEFSAGLEVYSDILGQAKSQQDLAKGEFLTNGGFKSVTDFITGQVETPAALIRDNFESQTNRAQETNSQIGAAILGNTDALLQVGIHAGSVFTNTLLSQLTQKLYEGFFDFNQPNIDPFNPSSFALSDRQDAQSRYRSLLSAVPLEITNYSILSDFSTCPTRSRGLYNCVADTSFISAISRADSGVPMTIQEAVDGGLIDAGWPLISPGDQARNQDPYCYTYGFCYGNLVKLRKARVISVGWELAAESQYNSVNSPVTLQEVLDGFDKCNAAGEPDANHPWCKLVDPNWVLKYPETQCRAEVYGQLLTSSASAERATECVDMPSCIAEDANGNCTGGYGYCVREENTWQFRGQSCPEQYASCVTVSNDEKTVSYLRNTTDPGPCSPDNAGCLWYETEKVQSGGEFVWPAVANVAAADAAPDANASRIYLTSAVEDCNAEDGGCRELIERDDRVRLNVVVNPSFENDEDKSGKPDAWLFNHATQSTWDQTPGDSRTGQGALKPGNATVYQPGVAFSQSRFYTMSFYARQATAGGADSAQMMIYFQTDDGSRINLAGTSFSSSCTLRDRNGSGTIDSVVLTGTPDGTGYERFTCTFTSPTQASAATMIIGNVNLLPTSTIIDDIQVEQGEDASSFHDGYSTQDLAKITVKVPPNYLGCTGTANDPEECKGYAEVCTENDVGCSLYTPSNGDPAVAGVANDLDYCPSVCVGYDTFKQEPTNYEPTGNFPVYFIPDTAEACSEEEVGCDSFTNLSTEGTEYFTYLRACVTPAQARANTAADNAATFYTWEGSDTAGYQLKTWSLLESNIGSSSYRYAASGEVDGNPAAAPCVNWRATNDGISCEDDADFNIAYAWDVPSCDEHKDIFTNPDCREFYDANGDIHYREWSKTVTVNAACSAYRKTNIVGNDATERKNNCEVSGGYFDGDTGTCRYYGFTNESSTCSEKANGCRAYTGGQSRNSRVAFEDLIESGNLNAWDTANAATLAYSNESIATDGHSISATAPFETFVVNNGIVCTQEGGCPGTAQSLGGSCTVKNGEQYCGTLDNALFLNKTYTLTFWAKGTGSLRSGFNLLATGGRPEIDADFGSVNLTTGWQRYSLGPLDMNARDYKNFGAGTTLAFLPSGTAFIDNITLREGEDNITLIKDSWVTPASCDQSPDGASSPQYYLGCQEYRNQDGKVSNLKSFSKLCDESKVGCQAFFMTQESASPHAEVHNAVCSTLNGLPAQNPTACYYAVDTTGVYDTTSPYLCTIGVGSTNCKFNLNWYVSPSALPAHLSFDASTKIVPADTDVFLVVNNEVTCSSGTAGCTELGNVSWSQDKKSVTGGESVYLMNLPDEYDKILCSQDELFCSAWTGDAGASYYFKDPGEKTCEYRTDVTAGGSTLDGWFKTGTNEPCYPNYVVGGNFSGVWKNGDSGYDGWVATCSAEYNACSEFQDPLDVPETELYGTGDGASYFSLANASLNENALPSAQKCNGKVSLKEGCGLFNDTGLSSKNYQSSATEMASRHADVLFNRAPFDLVSPINCEGGSSAIQMANGQSVDLCAQRCIYSDAAVHDITDRDGGYLYGTSCYAASDCTPVQSESGENVKASACGTVAPDSSPVPKLENDTNTVLKVNRDRQCSEWLSCANSTTVWDERTNSYRTICSDVELCTEYSALGDSSFCSQWKQDDPEIVLDTDRYTSRDVTWYGDDYSGYAIPNVYPVQTLTQENVAPPAGFCELSRQLASGLVSQAVYDAYQGKACNAFFDCNTDQRDACVTEDKKDYRLVLNAGTCEEKYGEACIVGTCSDTGAACSSETDCSASARCLIGACYAVNTSAVCASDSDCGSGQTCNGGFCATKGADVAANNNPTTFCGTQTFVPLISTKNGTCISGSCLLAPDGSKFSPGESEGKTCRAYPEVDSPFSSELVSSWFDESKQQKLSPGEAASWDDQPYSTRAGFDKANFCAPGEICECTYKKISFGTGQAETRYVDPSFDATGIGICTSGERTGASCTPATVDADCGQNGKCESPSREDTLLGMDGYCLERDTGININGDRNQNACVTWLPVDQLAGSTDLFGKYNTAGWSDDLFFCAEVSTYNNVGTMLGCSEILNDGGGASETNRNDCKSTIACPEGFWAVAGPAKLPGGNDSDHTSEAAKKCTQWVNACPYMCVPYNSVHANSGDGGACLNPNDDTSVDVSADSGTADYVNHTKYYFATDSYTDTDALFDAYKDCTYYGMKSADSSGDDELGYWSFPWGQDVDGGSAEDYHIFDTNIEGYLACNSLVQASDADVNKYNAVWTDRLLNPNSGLASMQVGSDSIGFSSLQRPWGHSIPVSDANLGDNSVGDPTPAVIPSCQGYNGTVIYPATDPEDTKSCSDYQSGDFEPAFDGGGDTEARTFLNVTSAQISHAAVGTNEGTSNVIQRLQKLFAAPVALWKWVSGTSEGFDINDTTPRGSYPEGDASTAPYDWDVREVEGNPPKVWSIDTSKCTGTECEEGKEGALTLNDKDSGNVTGTNFLRAYLKFYAAADKNQLPLRRVIVDWGDDSETGSPATDNFYKNHRGLQDGTTASKCDLGTEWGLTGESCDPNYFSYSHIYTCSAEMQQGSVPTCSTDANGNLVKSPCVTNPGSLDATCSFQPRVHIRDNWGWCTGTCSEQNGCFDGDEIDQYGGQDDCRYYLDSTDERDPWIYYDGAVTVNPRNE